MLAVITLVPKPGDAGGSVGGPPLSVQCRTRLSELQFPGHAHAPRHDGQRAVFGGIGGKLMQRERERLGGARLERHVGPGDRDPFGVAGAIGRKLLVDQAARGRRPASAICDSSVWARDSALMRPSTAAT